MIFIILTLTLLVSFIFLIELERKITKVNYNERGLLQAASVIYSLVCFLFLVPMSFIDFVDLSVVPAEMFLFKPVKAPELHPIIVIPYIIGVTVGTLIFCLLFPIYALILLYRLIKFW